MADNLNEFVLETLKLSNLYTRQSGITEFRGGVKEKQVDIFVNFNRFCKPFIRVNICKTQPTFVSSYRTFNFSNVGLQTMKSYIKNF